MGITGGDENLLCADETDGNLPQRHRELLWRKTEDREKLTTEFTEKNRRAQRTAREQQESTENEERANNTKSEPHSGRSYFEKSAEAARARGAAAVLAAPGLAPSGCGDACWHGGESRPAADCVAAAVCSCASSESFEPAKKLSTSWVRACARASSAVRRARYR